MRLSFLLKNVKFWLKNGSFVKQILKGISMIKLIECTQVYLFVTMIEQNKPLVIVENNSIFLSIKTNLK